MQAPFLTIIFCLVAALQAQDSSSLAFNNENLSGKWFMKALVAKDEIPITKVSRMTVFVMNNGNMELSLTHMIYGQCLKVNTFLKKTDVPGQYTAFDGKSRLQVQVSSVKDHYMLYCVGELEGMGFMMTQLIGRDIKENLEALKEFKEFTHEKSLDPEKLVIPEQMEKCEPESN